MTSDNLIGFKGNHIKLSVDKGDLGIAAATDLAKQKVKELSDDSMMLSWCCGKTGEYYPKTECGRTEKPPWIIFAESRGADIAININDGEYIFFFYLYNNQQGKEESPSIHLVRITLETGVIQFPYLLVVNLKIDRVSKYGQYLFWIFCISALIGIKVSAFCEKQRVIELLVGHCGTSLREVNPDISQT